MVCSAIQLVPTNKGTRDFEVFVEALKSDRHMVTKIKCKLWENYNTLKYTLKAWTTEILIPVYKKGEKSSPQSFWTIELLSHVRKTIESAVAIMIRKQYKFRDAWLGFR